MATLTEKYVTPTGAGAHDGSNEANAWTFAEMLAAVPAAGTRVNMKSGNYSTGIATLPSSGTVVAPIFIRGYNSTIGDLDFNARLNADGTLDVTGFPVLTVTGLITPSSYCILQNLSITGALSNYLISSTAIDNFGLIQCKMENTQNNSSAGCLRGDDQCWTVLCDFYCSGASHTIVVDSDNYAVHIGSYFKVTSTTATALQGNQVTAIGCILIGAGGASQAGIALAGGMSTIIFPIVNCTIYNFGRAIQHPSALGSGLLMTVANHITDCSNGIYNVYATGNISAMEICNRYRDIVTLRTSLLECAQVGLVTTDNGDYTTDYISNTNLMLRASAVGVGKGILPNMDIGARQRGAGLIKRGGLTGGLNG